jgi:hypothetical protein
MNLSNTDDHVVHEPKKVSFCDECLVEEISHHNFLSEDEVDTLWYTEEECGSMLQHSKKNTPSDVADEQDSTRGLEFEMFEWFARRKGIVRQVLKEQARQESLGCVDEEELAEVLRRASSHRRRIAHLRGIQDAQAVHHVIAESKQSDSKEIRAKHKLRRAKRRTEAATTA